MPDDHAPRTTDWRTAGVRVIKQEAFCTPPTATMGMNRMVAVSGATSGAQGLWAGTNRILPNSRTGAHHHGPQESIIYVVRGEAHMRWGDRLEWIAKAGPGEFLQVPAWVPHQEMNLHPTEELHGVVVRSGPEEIIVNIEVDAVAEPSWVE